MIDALILAASTPVITPRPDADGSSDIVVTGERVSRSKHQTATSVAIETGESIEAQASPDRIEQLLEAIPNVQLGSGGEGPTIRGQDSTGVVRDLPAFLSGTRPRTTVSIDGRSATYYELAFGLTSLWDVDRVEVFRSPQTTTQGRNSIGGAIFVETKDPAFDWEGKARLLSGNHETRQASVVVSGPIVDEQLAFRLSGDLRRSRTASRLTSTAVGINANRDDFELVRLKLLARPRTLSDVGIDLTYSHGRSQMPQIEGVRAPFEDRRDPNATYGIFAITVDSLTGRFLYEHADDFEARTTLSFGKADIRRHAPSGFGEADIDTTDLSVEPVFVWRFAGGASLTGGLHFTRATLDQFIDLAVQVQVQGSGVFDDVQNSLGAFGEAALPLAPTLSLTAGIRYQRDRQVRQGGLTGKAISLPLDYRRKFEGLLPKISVAWDMTPDLRLGVLAQRASNPGGININTNRARLEPFDAERLWDFEVFIRSRLDEGRLVLSANAFHYEMRDAQRTQTVAVLQPDGRVATSSQVDNAPRAWTKGLELEVDWRLGDRIHLRGAIGLLDTRVTRTLDKTDPISGKQFQRSPHFSGSASLVWNPSPMVMISGQVRGNSSYYSDDLESAERRIAGSTIVDAKGSWTVGRATLFGYVRNLFDEFHLTYLFQSTTGLATAGEPREFGLGIEALF